MDKNGHIEVFARREEFAKTLAAEIFLIHVCPNLHACEADRFTVFEFFYRESRVLHRHGTQPDKSQRKLVNRCRDLVIQELSDFSPVSGFRPVAEHHRHGRKHLNVYAELIALEYPFLRIPAVLANLSKKMAVVLYHASTARPVMFQLDESTVTESIFPFRNFLRQDMSVDVDF